MDIDGWLRGIGLEQYAQTFRDNAIDADVLCDLTDEHLRELGLPLGARLKLLRAVVALLYRGTVTTALPRGPAGQNIIAELCLAIDRRQPLDLPPLPPLPPWRIGIRAEMDESSGRIDLRGRLSEVNRKHPNFRLFDFGPRKATLTGFNTPGGTPKALPNVLR